MNQTAQLQCNNTTLVFSAVLGLLILLTPTGQGMAQTGHQLWQKQSATGSANFGWAVGNAGDVNLDQFDDMIVGDPPV